MVKLNSLLVDDYPLLVLPALAKEIGLNNAIVLQQIHFWLRKEKNFEGGRYWVYNTYDGWAEQFPFWSVSTVRRILSNLEERELVETGNYNKLRIDQTKWYTINYERLAEISDQLSKVDSPSVQIEQS